MVTNARKFCALNGLQALFAEFDVSLRELTPFHGEGATMENRWSRFQQQAHALLEEFAAADRNAYRAADVSARQKTVMEMLITSEAAQGHDIPIASQ